MGGLAKGVVLPIPPFGERDGEDDPSQIKKGWLGKMWIWCKLLRMVDFFGFDSKIEAKK